MCKDLRIDNTGNYVEHKKYADKYYTEFELILNRGCNNCTERFKCKLLSILEGK